MNIDRGLSNLGGNAQKLFKLLKRLSVSYDEKIKHLMSNPNSSISDLKQLIHALRGASGNLGWIRVLSICENLEKRILSGEDIPALIEDLNHLNKTLEKTISILNEAGALKSTRKAYISTSEEIDRVLLNAEELLLAFDTSVIDLIESHKESLKKLDETMTEELINYCHSFDFYDALILIKKLKSYTK